jgi:SAM-dependent methyltransferase
MLKTRMCKICGSEAEFMFERSWNGYTENFPYYCCKNPKCRFLYTDYLDNLSNEQISALYDGHIFGGGEDRAHLPLDKVELAKILQPNAKKILDFGSGEGLGVSILREAGFDAYGLDVVPPNVCEEYITTGTRDQLTGTYDIITAIEVLEHLIDPIEACHWIASHLREGGVFAFSTYTFEPRKHNAAWWYLDCVGHVSLHTRLSLSLLAEATGFKVVTDIFATHIWIRGDSVPLGAAKLIKMKHVLNKLFDARSYQLLRQKIFTHTV